MGNVRCAGRGSGGLCPRVCHVRRFSRLNSFGRVQYSKRRAVHGWSLAVGITHCCYEVSLKKYTGRTTIYSDARNPSYADDVAWETVRCATMFTNEIVPLRVMLDPSRALDIVIATSNSGRILSTYERSSHVPRIDTTAPGIHSQSSAIVETIA